MSRRAAPHEEEEREPLDDEDWTLRRMWLGRRPPRPVRDPSDDYPFSDIDYPDTRSR